MLRSCRKERDMYSTEFPASFFTTRINLRMTLVLELLASTFTSVVERKKRKERKEKEVAIDTIFT